MGTLIKFALLLLATISCSTLAGGFNRPNCNESIDVKIQNAVTAAKCTARTDPAVGASAKGLNPSAAVHFKCAEDVILSIAIVNEADPTIFSLISQDESNEVLDRCIMTEQNNLPYTVFIKRHIQPKPPGNPT